MFNHRIHILGATPWAPASFIRVAVSSFSLGRALRASTSARLAGDYPNGFHAKFDKLKLFNTKNN
jgi:hypothetical protein